MFYFVLWPMVMAFNIIKQLRGNKQEVFDNYIKPSVTTTNHYLPWQPAMYANFVQEDRYIFAYETKCNKCNIGKSFWTYNIIFTFAHN